MLAMNEIVIDDKKYVSSKQAAELTGYAKDYVGQLCREGRVPARLIGRSWYVLASAIQDHKFGGIDLKKQTPTNSVSKEPEPVISQTWEAPRYKAEPETYFPSINKLAPVKDENAFHKKTENEAHEQNSIQVMHEAWKDWFSGRKDAPSEVPITVKEAPEEEESKELFIETAEVKIPIRTIEEEESVPMMRVRQVIPPAVFPEEEQVEAPEEVVQKRKPNRFIQASLTVVVFAALSIGAIGSGYLDKIISSEKYLSKIGGITIINSK